MDYSVGILAGGKSTRFFSDKRNALFRGKTFLEHVLSQFSYSDDVILSLGATDFQTSAPITGHFPFPVRTVHDSVMGFGPMEGIARILDAAGHRMVFIVPVDMPLVDRSVADYLAAFCTGPENVVCPCVGGKLFPLCAFYSKEVLPLIEKLRSEGVHRLMDILAVTEAKTVDMSAFDEGIFMNVNEPEDYARLMVTDQALS